MKTTGHTRTRTHITEKESQEPCYKTIYKMNKEMEREKEKDRPLVGVVVEQGDIRRVILGGTI